MKFSKLIILAVAALGGYAVFKARLSTLDSDGSTGSGGGFYSNVTGPGSIGETYRNADAARKAGTTTDFSSESPLLEHSGRRSRIAAKNGLNQSAPVDEDLTNDQPLLTSAAKGETKQVEDRLANHARVDSRDSMRRTPLMYASGNGHIDICERLLAAGANPELRDRDGNNAFDYASGHGRSDVVEFLLKTTHEHDDQHYLEYAQLIQAVYAGDPAKMPEGTGKLASINHINPDGQSPIHIAAGNGSVAVLAALIARGADVNLANDNRQTPLLWAAWNNQPQAAELLLQNGADTTKTDLGGNTPLIMAVQNNSVATAKVLIKYGADAHVANKEGKSASIIAEDKGYNELVTSLK